MLTRLHKHCSCSSRLHQYMTSRPALTRAALPFTHKDSVAIYSQGQRCH